MYKRVWRTRAEWTAGYRRVLEARDPAASAERLRVLAADHIRPVRIHAAAHPNTPPDALNLLAVDDDLSVRRSALRNPRLSAEALDLMAEAEAQVYDDRVYWDRHFITAHPNTRPQLRSRLLAAGACDCPGVCHLARAF